MKYFLFLIFLVPNLAQAWTLNNNFTASFKDSSVKVSIDEGTTCAVAGTTVYELQDMVKSAIGKFWNEVPTSALRLKNGGFSSAVSHISDGVLCSPTDESCINSAGALVIPPVTDIVIACNNNTDNFGSGNILAVTIPNSFDGKKIKGAVILINNTTGTTAFASLSHDDRVAVIAHEIGHAIGLGHSEDREALMYYRTVNQRKKLGQDDIDGVTFLYPMQVDAFGLLKGGLLGGCGTIITHTNEPPKNPPFSQMGMTLAVIILLVELKRLFRSKARATA